MAKRQTKLGDIYWSKIELLKIWKFYLTVLYHIFYFGALMGRTSSCGAQAATSENNRFLSLILFFTVDGGIFSTGTRSKPGSGLKQMANTTVRSCVHFASDDGCVEGTSDGTKVTVCTSHCQQDACNAAPHQTFEAMFHLTCLISLLLYLRIEI